MHLEWEAVRSTGNPGSTSGRHAPAPGPELRFGAAQLRGLRCTSRRNRSRGIRQWRGAVSSSVLAIVRFAVVCAQKTACARSACRLTRLCKISREKSFSSMFDNPLCVLFGAELGQPLLYKEEFSHRSSLDLRVWKKQSWVKPKFEAAAKMCPWILWIRTPPVVRSSRRTQLGDRVGFMFCCERSWAKTVWFGLISAGTGEWIIWEPL